MGNGEVIPQHPTSLFGIFRRELYNDANDEQDNDPYDNDPYDQMRLKEGPDAAAAA
jgi:hypothetical protein